MKAPLASAARDDARPAHRGLTATETSPAGGRPWGCVPVAGSGVSLSGTCTRLVRPGLLVVYCFSSRMSVASSKVNKSF